MVAGPAGQGLARVGQGREDLEDRGLATDGLRRSAAQRFEVVVAPAEPAPLVGEEGGARGVVALGAGAGQGVAGGVEVAHGRGRSSSEACTATSTGTW